jgi:hypothetical protein
MATSTFQARALYDFVACNADEFSFSKGEFITVISEEDGGWYLGEYHDNAGEVWVGMLPSNFVERTQPTFIPTDATSQPGPSRVLPDGHASIMAAIESLNEQPRGSAGTEEITILPSRVKGRNKLASNESGAAGGNKVDVLFEDDEDLKSFYRNLDLDSKTADSGGQPSGQRHPQRDSGIGLQGAEGSSSDTESDTNDIDRVTSLLRSSRNPVHVLQALQADLGISELPDVAALDTQESGLSAEFISLESIINSSLERKEIPSSQLQASLIARLQPLAVWIETTEENDSSQTLKELDQKCARIVGSLVQLLNTTRSCVVCGNEEPASKYGPKITANCAHDTNTCKSCLQMWILSQIAEKGWDKIKCSECPELFQHSDVRENVDDKAFKR